MESLFGSLPEMLDFQRVFLQTLEERIASSPDFSALETPSQLKVRCTYMSHYRLNVQTLTIASTVVSTLSISIQVISLAAIPQEVSFEIIRFMHYVAGNWCITG